MKSTPFIDTSSGWSICVSAAAVTQLGEVHAGETHVSSVAEIIVAATSSTPKRHLVSPRSWNPVPVTVTSVPPPNGPPKGENCRMCSPHVPSPS